MIPGVPAYHPRSEWEAPDLQMGLSFTRTPTRITLSNITQPIAHYTAATNLPDGDAGESWLSIPQRLRNSQLDYLTNRTGGGYTRKSDGKFFPGYPLGYSFMVDARGHVWELRGFDYLPAATNQHNSYSVAVLFYVDGADKATDEAWASARAIAKEFRRRSGRSDFAARFMGHDEMRRVTGTGTPTACPGAGIESQLSTLGVIDYEPPAPPSEGETMQIAKARIYGYADQFLMVPITEGTNERISAEDQQPIVVTSPLNRTQLETEFGYKLTSLPGEV